MATSDNNTSGGYLNGITLPGFPGSNNTGIWGNIAGQVGSQAASSNFGQPQQQQPQSSITQATGGQQQTTPTPPPPGNVTATPNPQASNTSSLTGSDQTGGLINQLMGRANQSLNIDPNTDPIIRPQVDNYAAQQQRFARQAIDSAAESGNPYATGSLQNTRTQAAETGAQNTSQLQSTLTQNELNARRAEIQNALSESGSLLTGQQQMSLQQELGLLDAGLRQQQLTSSNDQFAAQLGLNAQNQSNYWNALQSGLING